MKKGEVWRAHLPPVPGHTQTGERPAVIVQNEPFLTALPTALIVPFTSRRAAGRFPGTLLVSPDGRNGLQGPSVALVFQLYVLDKRHLLYQLGELDAVTLDQIEAVITQLAL